MPQCESPPAMSGKTTMVAGQEILRSGKNDERAIMLGLLNAVERDSAVTQRGACRRNSASRSVLPTPISGAA